jgi:RimJ/RimL family protein N-acetyltransferase
MVILETERLYLRQWVFADWKRFKPLATDPRVLKYIGTGEPWSDEKIQEFVRRGIEAAHSRGWLLWPVIHRADGVLIGFCGFGAGFLPHVEIGWRLLPDYWGRGLATEAAQAVLGYGFGRFGFDRVISVAQPANRPSIRVMEKIGMGFERSFIHQGIEVVCYAKDNPAGATG